MKREPEVLTDEKREELEAELEQVYVAYGQGEERMAMPKTPEDAAEGRCQKNEAAERRDYIRRWLQTGVEPCFERPLGPAVRVKPGKNF